MKKLSVIILCLLLSLSFVSCGETENNGETKNNNNNQNNEDLDNNNQNNDDMDDELSDILVDGINYDEDPIDIEYLGTNTNNPELDNYPFTKNHLNEKFNIDLSFSPVAAIDKETIDLLIASESMPDCGWLYSGIPTGTAAEYYLNNIIRGYPKEYVQEYAPNVYGMFQRRGVYDLMHTAPDDDSLYYTVFANRYKFDTVGWTLALRYDWMENLGIAPKGNIIEAIPDSGIYLQEEAYTIDEFTDIIYQFTFSDPDMNDENDTIGHVTCKPNLRDHGYTATVRSAYGINGKFEYDEYGWCVPSEFVNKGKDAYEKIQEWINLGVTFKDLYSSTWADFWGTWNSGLGGSACTKLGFLNLTNLNENLFAIRTFVPDSKLVCGPGLVDNDGSGGTTIAYEENDFTESAGFFFISSKVTDDEKLKRILMLFDYMCINPVGYANCNNGLEGVHYNTDEDGYKEYVDEEDIPADMKILRGQFGTPGVNMANSPANPEGTAIKHIIYRFSIDYWPPCTTSKLITPTFFEINTDIEWYERENKQAKAKAFETFVKNVYTSVGTVDSEWDKLMSILDECGYEGYLVEMNTHGKLKEYYDNGEIVHPTDIYPIHYPDGE